MGWHSFWGHFCTITRHRHTVMRHCRRAGIFWQGLRHDLSKYSPTEFWQGVRYYQDGKRSPNEAEREALGYSLAWMHHKGRNRHHFEYWADYNPRTKQVEPVEMPVRFLAEMFCDRVAASKIYMKDAYDQTCPLAYFQKSTSRKRGLLHANTERELMRLLTLLAEQGEDAAFAELRLEHGKITDLKGLFLPVSCRLPKLPKYVNSFPILNSKRLLTAQCVYLTAEDVFCRTILTEEIRTAANAFRLAGGVTNYARKTKAENIIR